MGRYRETIHSLHEALESRVRRARAGAGGGGGVELEAALSQVVQNEAKMENYRETINCLHEAFKFRAKRARAGAGGGGGFKQRKQVLHGCVGHVCAY